MILLSFNVGTQAQFILPTNSLKRSQRNLILSSGGRPWNTFAPAGLKSIALGNLLLRHTGFMPGDSNNLLHSVAGSATMDVYSSTARKLNRYTKTSTGPWEERGEICSVDKIQPRVFGITSTACNAPTAPIPNSILAVLRKWGYTWLWEHMRVEGVMEWISEAIQDRSLVVVIDGSYIRQLHQNLCLAAFVVECAKGGGKIIRTFSESTLAANVYRGELLGLMAIHLLLVSVNRVHNTLVGSVEVVSGCLGALKRVVHLPPYWIPLHCKHSDILKNIPVNCQDLTFTLYYLHVIAHQDDNVAFNKLSQKSQLSCICDHLAKQCISESTQQQQQDSYLFPLEPIGIFIKGAKLLSGTGQQISFHVPRQLAKALFLRK